MLHLAARTTRGWAAWAVARMDEILLDHAHCEKKAASTAIGLIFRYPDVPRLAVPLSRLAREELEHFEIVVEHVRRRGGEFRRLEPSAYASRLMTIVRTHEPERLLDTLLCCAMIEARSCERMQLVAEALEQRGDDPDLVALYRGLLASEARHHNAYLDLARPLAPDDALRSRLATIAAHEADVIATATPEARLHSAEGGFPDREGGLPTLRQGGQAGAGSSAAGGAARLRLGS
jgi:tRNA-(ms[2]io[6]A)-hydroxylase